MLSRSQKLSRAVLPAFLRAKGRSAVPLWVLTTNYDTTMEQALADADEPFHLLYYIGGTARDDDGLFAVRAPDGSARIIEQPDNFRWLGESATVVVKLNGGLVFGPGIPESVVVASGHFERLAARIPQALPFALRTTLHERSLLFLGHGLAEPDVEALIQYSAPNDRTIKSWAVQLPPRDPRRLSAWEERARYWKSWGLEILRIDLGAFVAALHRSLLTAS